MQSEPTPITTLPVREGDTLDAALMGALRQRLAGEFAEMLAAGFEKSIHAASPVNTEISK